MPKSEGFKVIGLSCSAFSFARRCMSSRMLAARCCALRSPQRASLWPAWWPLALAGHWAALLGSPWSPC